jgi:hypothetical protein
MENSHAEELERTRMGALVTRVQRYVRGFQARDNHPSDVGFI